jgi:hypothetical protein
MWALILRLARMPPWTAGCSVFAVHGHAGLLQSILGAAGAEDLDVQLGQAFGEINQPGLVRDAQDSSHVVAPFEELENSDWV